MADSSSDGNAEEDSDDPGRLSKDLALIMNGRYGSSNYRSKGKSKNYDSDDEKKTNKFFKKKNSSSSKSSPRSSSKNPSKSSSNHKNTSRKAKTYIGKEMESEEEESSGSEEEEESDEDFESDMVGIACASSATTNFFGNPSSDDKSLAYCFMAKASKEKVSSKHHKTRSSDKYSSDEDDHAKLIKIANIQQNSLEKIKKTLRKSEGLLLEEMEKNQSLTEECTEWIMDSGCTSHMTGDKSLFVNPNLTTSPLKYITFGDNNKGKSVADSAKVHSMANDQKALMGTVDESKALNAKGPTGGPSSSKRKRSEPNADEQEAKHLKNAEKRAKKAAKDQAKEEENRHLIKSDVEKKKAEGKVERGMKIKYDPKSADLKKKSAPRKRPAKPVEHQSDSSDRDDPPLTREEIDATLSKQVNVTTSTIMPDLRESVVLVAAPKKIHLKRKTPHTIVTMVDKLNIDPHPDAINLQDVVVQAPVGSAKPGEQLPRQKMKQIKGPAAKQKVPSTDAVMEKAEQFAPKLTQPLASLPLTEKNVAQTAPTAQTTAQPQNVSVAPHSFDHTFIME
nr:DNA ligase 1-like [Aegilops tauschii subsp. strangulata]